MLCCALPGLLVSAQSVALVPKDSFLSVSYLGQMPVKASEEENICIGADSSTIWVYDLSSRKLFYTSQTAQQFKHYSAWKSRPVLFQSARYQYIRPGKLIRHANNLFLSFDAHAILWFMWNGKAYEEQKIYYVGEGFKDFFVWNDQLYIYTLVEAFAGKDNHYIKSIDLHSLKENKVYLNPRYSPFAFLHAGSHCTETSQTVYLDYPQSDSLYAFDTALNARTYVLSDGEKTWLPENLTDSLQQYDREKRLDRIASLLFKQVDSISLNVHLLAINDSMLVRLVFEKGIYHEYATIYVKRGQRFYPVKKGAAGFPYRQR
jgi:hypothetical protein